MTPRRNFLFASASASAMAWPGQCECRENGRHKFPNTILLRSDRVIE